MRTVFDQLNRKLCLPEKPSRIVSLVPSQTELLADLGLTEHVIGITKFCVHPENLRTEKAIVGGTKNLDFKKIESLQPDLIISNKEENEFEQIIELSKTFPVWVSDIKNRSDALRMINEIGDITGTREKANEICKDIETSFNHISVSHVSSPKKAIYLIWRNPYLSVGGDTFIHDMINSCGLMNVLASRTRYPEISMQEMRELKPDVILLSSEPFPFNDDHLKELKEHFPQTIILLVDGEMFSWYGSRMRMAPEYFRKMLKKINSTS